MQFYVETERLILRDIRNQDAEGLFLLDSDPEVHKYLGNKPVQDMQQITEVIEFIQQQYKDNGIGRWAMIEKQSGNFVGWTGLKYMRTKANNHCYYYDVGYRLIRKYWGKGYASESVAASLVYGFETLKLREIFAMAHIENIASQHVLQKNGLVKHNAFQYENEPHYWFSILNNT